MRSKKLLLLLATISLLVVIAGYSIAGVSFCSQQDLQTACGGQCVDQGCYYHYPGCDGCMSPSVCEGQPNGTHCGIRAGQGFYICHWDGGKYCVLSNWQDIWGPYCECQQEACGFYPPPDYGVCRTQAVDCTD